MYVELMVRCLVSKEVYMKNILKLLQSEAHSGRGTIQKGRLQMELAITYQFSITQLHKWILPDNID